VVRETFAFSAVPDDDYVMVKYTLTNLTAAPVTDLHIGEILDVDVASPGQNSVAFIAAGELAQTTSLGTTVSHGHILLSDPVTSYRGFCSAGGGCPNSDPATLAGWFDFLSGGIVGLGPIGPSDSRELLTTAPVDIPAGGSRVLFTALVGGDDPADLSVNVAAARAKFAALPQAAKDPVLATGVEVSFRKFKAFSQGAAVATLTFGSPAEASLFDGRNVGCGEVSPRQTSVARSKATLKFNVTDFDTERIRDGDRIACGGKLTDGTLYGGTTILTVKQKLMPVTRLTSIGQNLGPTWSPDGNSIAFVSDRAGLRSIWRMDLAAGEASAVQLTAGGGFFSSERNPDWSPDGSTIAFSRDGGIFTVPAAGGAETQLTGTSGFDQDPRWSPDGSQIAFQRGQSVGFPFGNHIWTMSAAGEIASGVPAVAIATNGGLDIQPEWATDRLLYFTRSAGDVGIFSVDPLDPEPGTAALRVTPDEGTGNRHPAISPDGNTLAFLSSSSAGVEIVLQDLGTGEHTIVPLDTPVSLFLASTNQNIEFSPDGRQILFAASSHVYVVDISKLK
jgi:dipeptidyl aminopeptidase/acylaminoacyl peptidase